MLDNLNYFFSTMNWDDQSEEDAVQVHHFELGEVPELLLDVGKQLQHNLPRSRCSLKNCMETKRACRKTRSEAILRRKTQNNGTPLWECCIKHGNQPRIYMSCSAQ